ncbi:MAG: sugar phosphate isomerase/epimerase [Ruminococcaceae bacterium]|nr:sugar phosphate isomerase/epimerase [Oscillospiraceae bacterium]
MKLSIWSSYYVDLTIEEAIEQLIRNGIYCSELSDEHGCELLSRSDDISKTAKTFSAFLKEKNFEISQGHLYLSIKICSDESALKTLYRWIDFYEMIGIKNMVLHCDNMLETTLDREERVNRNVEKLKELAEYIKDKEITVCLENLRPHFSEDEELVDRNADDLLYILDRVGSDRFGICLDTGHLNLTDKNQREFILKAGSRLKAIHIADNEGEIDQHLMPFTCGNVDFCEVVKALRQVNYSGVFNLEIPGERKIPLELRAAKLAYIKACYDYLMRS